VEALWALDQPPGSLDLHGMLRDTLAALDQLPAACARFHTNLPRRAQSILAQLEIAVRRGLDPIEAYSMVLGRSPPKRLSTRSLEPTHRAHPERVQ
jgi:hypothetical protein